MSCNGSPFHTPNQLTSNTTVVYMINKSATTLKKEENKTNGIVYFLSDWTELLFYCLGRDVSIKPLQHSVVATFYVAYLIAYIYTHR